MNSSVMTVIVIGLGHQSVDDHLPAIRDSSMLHLVGVCDIDTNKAKSIGEEYGVLNASSVTDLVGELDDKPDIRLAPHLSISVS